MLLVNKVIFPVTAYNGCKDEYTKAVSNNIRINTTVISEYSLSSAIPMSSTIISKRILPISCCQGNHVDYTVSELANNPFCRY